MRLQQSFRTILASLSVMALLFAAGCQNEGAASLQNAAEQAEVGSFEHTATDRAAYQAAMELKDTTYCDRISDKNYQQQCKNQLSDKATLQQILPKNDPSLCEKLLLQDNRDACKISIEVRIKTGQEEKQNEATNLALQKLRDEIIQSGNYVRCAELKDENYRVACELQILSGKAFETKDASWCDKATNESVKTQCKDISR